MGSINLLPKLPKPVFIKLDFYKSRDYPRLWYRDHEHPYKPVGSRGQLHGVSRVPN